LPPLPPSPPRGKAPSPEGPPCACEMLGVGCSRWMLMLHAPSPCPCRATETTTRRRSGAFLCVALPFASCTALHSACHGPWAIRPAAGVRERTEQRNIAHHPSPIIHLQMQGSAPSTPFPPQSSSSSTPQHSISTAQQRRHYFFVPLPACTATTPSLSFFLQLGSTRAPPNEIPRSTLAQCCRSTV
jgi:hypothetical protein